MKTLEDRKREIFNEFPKLSEIPDVNFPKHIFIIPDGNRRYAKKHGKNEFWGHKKGFDVALNLLRYFRPLPINTVTLWGFAADNWKRSKLETNNLMRIFSYLIDNHLQEIKDYDSRFVHLGRRDRLPKSLVNKIEKAEEETKNNKGQIVCLAVDFGGEDQNVRTAKMARQTDLEINEESIWKLRDTEGLIRSADLIFRTSETRTSDVGWLNGKHSVLYFAKDKLFPEITEADLSEAIYYYSQTKRNEGK
jgi:undecaprenyl diphosphate synthase